VQAEQTAAPNGPREVRQDVSIFNFGIKLEMGICPLPGSAGPESKPSRNQRRKWMATFQFKKGDFANAIAKNGEEVKVQIVDKQENGRFVVQLYGEDGLVNGPPQQAEPSSLLPLRGPYFDIRGLVLTTSSAHPGEIGEIVKKGSSKAGKAFFGVLFADGSSEWLGEDQVFIDDAVRPPAEAKKSSKAPSEEGD
jgi:hypothetical protein